MKNTKENRIALREASLKVLLNFGWTIDRLENCIVCRKSGENNRGNFFDLKIFKGTAAKPVCYFTFRSSEAREKYATETVANIDERGASKASRQAAKAEEHYFVGDVLYSSWGYEQTNVEFYQVVEVKGSSVYLREVYQNSSDVHGSPHGGRTQPRRNEFINDKVVRKLVAQDGSVKAPIHGWLSKWTGKSDYTSSYYYSERIQDT